MNERLDEEGIKALLSNEIRSSLTYDDTELSPKHTLEFTEVVRRSNLIQQILKHDPDSGRVYTADVYRVLS